MTTIMHYDPYDSEADDIGNVVEISAIVKGKRIWVPKKLAWCYRHEIAADAHTPMFDTCKLSGPIAYYRCSDE